MNYLYLLVLVTCIVQLVLVFTKVDKSTRQLICGITTLTIVWLFTTSDSLQIPTLFAILGGVYCIIYPNFKKCWIALGGYTICLCLIYLMNHTMEGYVDTCANYNTSTGKKANCTDCVKTEVEGIGYCLWDDKEGCNTFDGNRDCSSTSDSNTIDD